MSRLLEALYEKNAKREMSRALRVVYLCLGVVAAAFLITAYYSQRQLLHQIVTTVCLVAMTAINGFCDVKKNGFQTYLMGHFRKDFGILIIWFILLIFWVVDPKY